jgi:O-antigen/teichoic acid export membrane protein
MAGYGFSLDWLAWGLKDFIWMSGWRASVSLLGLVITVSSVLFVHGGTQVIALANGIAYVLSAYFLWIFWGRYILGRFSTTKIDSTIKAATDWKPVLWMGLAMLANQAFASIDIIILGSLSNSTQTGLYSAAYRIFLLVLAVYYLIMQAIYPQLAAVPVEQRNLQTLRPYLSKIVLIATCIAILMELMRSPIITIFYGAAFDGAIKLATPILLSIPLELVASFLLTAVLAWGQSRTALLATVVAGICNATLNFLLIPRFQALGAAYTTPISYAILLLLLLVCLSKSSRTNLLQGGREAISPSLYF